MSEGKSSALGGSAPGTENALTFVAALGGFLFGYDTAVISGAVGAIDHNFIEPLGLSDIHRSRF